MDFEKDKTVVGVFPGRRVADLAVDELRTVFAVDQIGILSRDDQALAPAKDPAALEASTVEPDAGNGDSYVDTGVLIGSLTGGSLGGLAAIGLVPLVLPLFGPIVAGGAMIALVANAIGGAVAGGVAGAVVGGMVGSGLSNEDMKFYQDELRAGRIVVMVRAGDRAEEARAILEKHGAHDIHSAGGLDKLAVHHVS